MQNKTSLRYHCTLIKSTKYFFLMRVPNAGKGCREKVSLIHCWWKCKMIYPLCKIPHKFNKKNKIKMKCPKVGISLEWVKRNKASQFNQKKIRIDIGGSMGDERRKQNQGHITKCLTGCNKGFCSKDDEKPIERSETVS